MDKDGWIPVTEDKPKDAQPVLITYGCGELRLRGIAHYTSFHGRKGKVDYFRFRDPDDGQWYNLTTGHDVIRPFEVLAWMPLPEAYKGPDLGDRDKKEEKNGINHEQTGK